MSADDAPALSVDPIGRRVATPCFQPLTLIPWTPQHEHNLKHSPNAKPPPIPLARRRPALRSPIFCAHTPRVANGVGPLQLAASAKAVTVKTACSSMRR